MRQLVRLDGGQVLRRRREGGRHLGRLWRGQVLLRLHVGHHLGLLEGGLLPGHGGVHQAIVM